MKKTLILLLIVTVWGCNQQEGKDETASVSVTVKNNDAFAHKDEQVIIERSALKQLEEQWKQGLVPLVANGKEVIASQADDLDGDGIWDELALVLNLAEKSQVELNIEAVKEADIPEFPTRAHAFLRKSADRNGEYKPVKEEILPKDHLPQSQPPLYQMEGPVWENDKGAFRLYFDARNGKDIFGKSISHIMMDSVGLPGDNYHQQAPWGMDVLKVGNSLGSGSVAFLAKDDEGKETIYRLGGQMEEMKYKLIADGPVRAIIQFDYTGAKAGEMVFNAQEVVSIWAGSPGFKSKITVTDVDKPVQLVTGIVNLHATTPPVEKEEEKYVLLATHDQQSENNDYLGMALLASRENFVRFDEAREEGAEVTDTYTLVLQIEENTPVAFEFLTLWEGRDKAYTDPAVFLEEIETYARQQFSPVNIAIE